MNDRRDLWPIIDALLVFVPFSVVGAIFGDAVRKDALTRRQRAAAALFSLAIGPILGMVVIRDLGWSDWTGLAVAAVVPTLSYYVIALAAAVLRQGREDPRGWVTLFKDTVVAALQALLPWRR